MNKKYNLKLDLQFRCNNSTMKFNQFDNNTSDFFIHITNGGKSFDIEKSIVVLAVIKPSGKVSSQFIEVKNDAIYADLKADMKDEIGKYTAQAMLILEDERVITDTIIYEVNESNIISAFIEDTENQEEYTLLTDMLSRLSIIELNEANREDNFNSIKEQFKEIKNNHNNLVTTQTNKKVIELLDPVINQTNIKIDEVDNKISEVERFVEAKEAEINKNLDENTKKINDKIIDIDYKTLISTNKVDVAISKIPPKNELIGPQGIQGIQGPKGDKGDTPSITHLETNISNKINELEKRFNTLTSSQQQSSEVVDARDGEVSLKDRLDRDKEELDKIRKLEESTVSTIATESDFTTVEETSNGYFEDVKLEGKTLVNLIEDIPFNYSATYPNRNFNNWKMLKPSTQYTFALLGDFTNAKNILISNSSITEVILPKNSYGQVFTFTTPSNLNEFTSLQRIYVYKESIDLTELQVAGWKLIILEGDHTQNPPSFFEGLMSVGQDVDEVSVMSVNENLFDGNWMLGTINALTGVQEASTTSVCSDYIHIHPSETLVYYFDNQYYNGINAKVICFYDKDKNFLRGGNMSGIKNIPENTSYCRIRTRKDDSTDITQSDINNIGKCVLAYKDTNVSHQSDKKPLLYYNPTTQAWGKPILRQWDSIEKHSDGKYYYHKRSREVVLNGSENWILNNVDDNICRIRLQVNEIKPRGHIIANTLVTGTGQDSIYIHPSEKIIDIRLNVNKATNLEGAKQWLQANPATVVYQLAQEEVYECTNIDLITYEGETNYIISSGAISPKSTLKVHNNISNVVKILQEKVNLLESNVKASQEVQDMMILESDMRILDIELALMEFIPMKLNLGGSDMLRSATYFNFLKNHIVNETYEKEYLENVMNKYLATNRLTQEEYDELYKMLYPPKYDIELPIEY